MKLYLAETPACQGLAQLVAIVIGTFPSFNCILQESRHLRGPETLGAKYLLAISLHP